jgi:hypothetical protein
MLDEAIEISKIDKKSTIATATVAAVYKNETIRGAQIRYM